MANLLQVQRALTAVALDVATPRVFDAVVLGMTEQSLDIALIAPTLAASCCTYHCDLSRTMTLDNSATQMRCGQVSVQLDAACTNRPGGELTIAHPMLQFTHTI